ncbi:hypothetical protein M409DRAFT_61681 [Zasmidium cellare ATCC 36951]|uniref:Uncharacterized protein n=1 Tax=Zasmidium cellare ATCC 36951 TaxID=1080233 RepID=A0A6A6BUE1_ZASCE|nr:uncharacterized protein M409DRAFT_61681 [Zasmidium cellare ATCC 36951]KAF2158414.1 hypothetical protein M409DRAFT_61681 [Zasmidium cellare ATCC 36951]
MDTPEAAAGGLPAYPSQLRQYWQTQSTKAPLASARPCHAPRRKGRVKEAERISLRDLLKTTPFLSHKEIAVRTVSRMIKYEESSVHIDYNVCTSDPTLRCSSASPATGAAFIRWDTAPTRVMVPIENQTGARRGSAARCEGDRSIDHAAKRRKRALHNPSIGDWQDVGRALRAIQEFAGQEKNVSVEFGMALGRLEAYSDHRASQTALLAVDFTRHWLVE